MPKYEVQLDLGEINDSRSLAIARVPAGSRVLDVGIGDGTVGRTLRTFGCQVWGIEYDKELAERSRDVYEDLAEGDVEQIDLLGAFNSQKFDVVLLLDVLEHLRGPAIVLDRVRDVLSEEGFVVISLPNIAHAAVKLQLLEGKFTYTEEGLLDSTHLRFFDLDNVTALLDEAGFEMFDLARVTREVTNTEIPVDISTSSVDLLAKVVEDPESSTYQFVLTAAPRESVVLNEPPITQATILQREVSRLRSELASLREPGERPWLTSATIDFINETLAVVHQRALDDQNVLRSLVQQFDQTVRDLRAELDSTP